jgi:hypothetical protein
MVRYSLHDWGDSDDEDEKKENIIRPAAESDPRLGTIHRRPDDPASVMRRRPITSFNINFERPNRYPEPTAHLELLQPNPHRSYSSDDIYRLVNERNLVEQNRAFVNEDVIGKFLNFVRNSSLFTSLPRRAQDTINEFLDNPTSRHAAFWAFVGATTVSVLPFIPNVLVQLLDQLSANRANVSLFKKML